MTSLTIVRQIKAPPAIVFDAFTSPDAIRKWWGPDSGPVLIAETDVRVGGRFKVRFRTGDGSEHQCEGAYLELDRPHRITMSWRWNSGGMLEEHDEDSRIEVELKPTATGTELSFTHAMLHSEASRASHESGWNGALDKLERLFAEASETDASKAA